VAGRSLGKVCAHRLKGRGRDYRVLRSVGGHTTRLEAGARDVHRNIRGLRPAACFAGLQAHHPGILVELVL